MRTIKNILSLVLTACVLLAHGQSPKAKNGTFALTNASIETVTKGVINNGTIIIRNGKIESVGTNIQVPSSAEVIDCSGKWVYPGMIESGSKLGLFEIGQIAQASDVNELGDVIPQMKA